MSGLNHPCRIVAGLLVGALLAGCSAGATPTSPPVVPPTPAPSAAAATAPTATANPTTGLSGPDRARAAGTLVWCSSTDYPPMESAAADGAAEGLDIDIAAGVAKRMGVSSRIEPTGFDELLTSLAAGKCDLVISSMASTFRDRKLQADFVDYLTAWTGLLVAPGNPKGIRTLDDLAGKSVAVAPAFVNEASLRAASDALSAAGKPAIRILTDTRSDEEWIRQLTSGGVDALAGDSMDVAYHATRPPYAGASEVGGPAVNPQPLGIAVRKDDTGMKEAVAAAIAAMKSDGTMKSVVAKWGMTDAVTLLK